MKDAVVLQHADFEGPGRLVELLDARGYAIDLRSVHKGDPIPERLDSEQLLVVMGGSMGVGDLDRPEFAFLNDEIRLLRRCVAEDAPVLGVCLGAQLLAHAAGARVVPMVDLGTGARSYEVGWAPIRFHHETGDGVLAGLPSEAHVLHWHGDMFDPPPGAILLASSEVCANQGFRLKRRLFGLQFHCEVDREHTEVFLRADEDYVRQANGPDGVTRLRSDTLRYGDDAGRVSDVLLRNIVEAMARP